MSWAGSVFRIQWTESRLLFLPFFSNRFLFCKELGIPLVDFSIPSLSYPFDVLTTFPRKRVIFLVLCFWICICSPRFGEISALMSLSKFFYAFSLLIRIEYLTFYSCTLKIYGFYLKIHPIHPLLISKQPRLLLSCTSSYFLPVIVSQLISLLLFLKLILHTIGREILLKIHSFQWLSLHLELGRNYVLWWPCDLAPMPFFLISYHSAASVLLSFLGHLHCISNKGQPWDPATANWPRFGSLNTPNCLRETHLLSLMSAMFTVCFLSVLRRSCFVDQAGLEPVTLTLPLSSKC